MIADLTSNVSRLLRRLRFSLRALFLITTVAAVICTYIVLPTLTARRFMAAVADKNFVEADNFFRNPTDKFLAEWADKKWAFKATADVAPWSLSQVFGGKREVAIRLRYFEFDHDANCTANVAAGSLGLGPPTISPVSYGGRLIDEIRGSVRPRQEVLPTR
jgi:hypothetical protein